MDENEIRSAIVEQFGSLSEPDYSFVVGEWSKDPYRILIVSLEEEFSVKDLAQPGADLSHWLELAEKTDEPSRATYYYLRLSMVGRFAVLTRLTRSGPVLAREADGRAERWIIEKVVSRGIELLPREVLERPIPLCVVSRLASEICVFNALFDDEVDLLPWEYIENGVKRSSVHG